MTLPQVTLPSDDCLGCSRDTDTGFAVEGVPEFHGTSLVKLAGMSFDDAKALVLASKPRAGGEEYIAIYRLCQDCAEKAGTRVVGLLGESSLPAYEQRKMFPDGGGA